MSGKSKRKEYNVVDEAEKVVEAYIKRNFVLASAHPEAEKNEKRMAIISNIIFALMFAAFMLYACCPDLDFARFFCR